jgi:hypothetical protein
MVKDISKELQAIPPDGLRASFYDIVAKSNETQTSLAAAAAQGNPERPWWRATALHPRRARRRISINTR